VLSLIDYQNREFVSSLVMDAFLNLFDYQAIPPKTSRAICILHVFKLLLAGLSGLECMQCMSSALLLDEQPNFVE